MLESLSAYFVEQGILGVLLFLMFGVIVYLFKLLQAGHGKALEDKEQVVKALLESSNASTQIARSVEQTNELLRNLVSQRSQ